VSSTAVRLWIQDALREIAARVYERATGVYCEDCGLDLTLTPEQLEALKKWGNPVRRQPCTANEDGLHRIAGGQLAS
jgi:hypothetical protein